MYSINVELTEQEFFEFLGFVGMQKYLPIASESVLQPVFNKIVDKCKEKLTIKQSRNFEEAMKIVSEKLKEQSTNTGLVKIGMDGILGELKKNHS